MGDRSQVAVVITPVPRPGPQTDLGKGGCLALNQASTRLQPIASPWTHQLELSHYVHWILCGRNQENLILRGQRTSSDEDNQQERGLYWAPLEHPPTMGCLGQEAGAERTRREVMA